MESLLEVTDFLWDLIWQQLYIFITQLQDQKLWLIIIIIIIIGVSTYFSV